jgi:UDP-N-acetylmuramoyl-tripeptide--D-alanyl-D-alanine ligase
MKPWPLREIAAVMGATLSRDPGEQLVTRLHTDSRTVQSGDCFVALSGNKFNGHHFVSQLTSPPVVAAVVSEKNSHVSDERLVLLEVPDTLLAFQRFSAHYRSQLPTGIIGVTGSSGKTSTKEMIAAVLSQKYRTQATCGNLNNHLGVPLTLLSLAPATEWGVVEMGMNHRGEIAQLAEIAAPTIGVISNVGTAHLEHLRTRENIALEKTDLIAALPPSGVAVLNADDLWSVRHADRTSARIIWAGLSEKAQVRAEEVTIGPRGVSFRLVTESGFRMVQLPIFSRVMVSNALLAAGVGMALGLSLDEIVAGLESVELTGQRMEVQSWRGGYVINDAYNANPDSMIAALRALQEFPAHGRRLAVLGSMGELGQEAEELHREVGAEAARLQLDGLVAVGPAADWLVAGAQAAGWREQPIITTTDGASALPEVLALAQAEDVLLVKGSRFLKLETLVDGLIKHRGED